MGRAGPREQWGAGRHARTRGIPGGSLPKGHLLPLQAQPGALSGTPRAPPQLRGQVAGSAAGWHEELRTQHCWQGRGDRLDAMWQLLMPLALWLGAVGLGRAELTAAQQRGLQVALEEFHKHPPVQWAFRETGVDSATETVSGIAKWRRLGRDGARSQEAGAQALSLRNTQFSRERPTPQPPSQLFPGGLGRRNGSHPGLLGELSRLLVLLCPRAALPCRDLCEAGI